MEYLSIVLLTIAISFAILKITKKRQKKVFYRSMYKQSDMHRFMKNFFSKVPFEKNQKSQMTKREQDNIVQIVAVDDKAYWVANNVFYVSDLIDDRPDIENATPVDTSNMSKDDIDKMLFILDNLDRGNRNERGSTGN